MEIVEHSKEYKIINAQQVVRYEIYTSLLLLHRNSQLSLFNVRNYAEYKEWTEARLSPLKIVYFKAQHC